MIKEIYKKLDQNDIRDLNGCRKYTRKNPNRYKQIGFFRKPEKLLKYNLVCLASEAFRCKVYHLTPLGRKILQYHGKYIKLHPPIESLRYITDPFGVKKLMTVLVYQKD